MAAHRQLAEPNTPTLFGDRLAARMHLDHSRRILPWLLKFGDGISMASSLESRLPFLDHRLVEFVFQLPSAQILHGSKSKVVLRKAMKGLVPGKILDRQVKIGFATPLDRWLAPHLETAIRPLLLSQRCRERGIFEGSQIEKAIALQRKRGTGFANRIFSWLSIELWHRMFIDGDALPS